MHLNGVLPGSALYKCNVILLILLILMHITWPVCAQGYHDIVVTFLLVVGEDYTFALMDKLSQNHLKWVHYDVRLFTASWPQDTL